MGLLNIIRRMAVREKQSIREINRRTGLAINNANAAIAWPFLKSGGHGFSRRDEQLPPRSLSRAYDHGGDYPDLANEIDTFLVLSAISEGLGYPKLAKHFHRRIGTFEHVHSRAVP